MKVLAILYCYPPLLVPASICYAKLMAGLHENGVDVEIVTISPDTFVSPGPIPPDEGLKELLPPFPNHVIRSPETSLWVRTLKRIDPSRRFTYRWFEPRKREWTLPAARYLRKLDLSRFDVLLTCSQPHANHLLGLEIKRRTGLPWIAYFSDPWAGNPFAPRPSARLRGYEQSLERDVVRSADLVLFTCEEMKRLVRDGQPDLQDGRCGVLPHAFVPDWYDRAGNDHRDRNGPLVRLLQTGSFYGPRTPLPLLDALERVSAHVPLQGALEIDIYGGIEDVYLQMIRRRGLDRIVQARGFVPYLRTLSLMRSYDALMLVDAPLDGQPESVFLPSKLIDYLGSSSPVVAVTPARGATARVVREVGGVVCPLESPGELDRFLLETIRAGRIQDRTRVEAVAKYDYRRIGLELAQRMQHVTGRQS